MCAEGLWRRGTQPSSQLNLGIGAFLTLCPCLLPAICRLGPARHQGMRPGQGAPANCILQRSMRPCRLHAPKACPFLPVPCAQSVLVVAGGLLRSQEGQDEQDVLFRALR